jgi:hypothetical protein
LTLLVAARARVRSTLITNQWLIAALVGYLALSALPARANWLSSDDLERHCGAYLGDPVSAEAAGCIAFVQGYVAATGAGSTLIEARDDAERFAERAARTRAGGRLRGMREEPASRRAFCVEGTAPAAVIETVATYLSRTERAEDEPPELLVHRALVAQFPCSDG